jgi:hypothetical protein
LKDLNKNEKVSFSEFLDSLNLDENTYILSLRKQLTKSNIEKNKIPYKCVTHLLFSNTYIQNFLNPYAIATYCTTYVTKINKSITS